MPRAVAFIVAIVACALFACVNAETPAIVREYGIEAAWIAGLNTVENSLGSFGTLGVPSPDNYPGTRVGSCSWMYINPDTGNSTLYVYGGLYGTSLTQAGWQDMWRFDPATTEWTWIDGLNVTSTTSTSPGTPGLRFKPQCWVVRERLYLYGGRSASIYPDDIWYFNITENAWTLHTASTGTLDCGSHTVGPRAGAMVWAVPDDNPSYYGERRVYIFSGFTASTTGFNNIWRWEEDLGTFLCLQDYPTSTTTITTPDRDWSSPSAIATYPGQLPTPNLLTSPGWSGWVGSDSMQLLVLSALTSTPNVWVYMGYRISDNRWSVISRPSGGNTNALYPAYVNITETPYPTRMYYHWTVWNPLNYGEDPLVYSLVDIPLTVPSPGTRQYNIWVYQYASDTWTWVDGTQYNGLEEVPAFGPKGVYSPTYAVGNRLNSIFQSTYLPYALPAGNPRPLVYIGFGAYNFGGSTRIADLWAYHVSKAIAPVDSWNAPTTVEYTFLGGSQGNDTTGDYGTLNVSTPDTRPPGRQYAYTWTYTPPDGGPSTLYLFGGVVFITDPISSPMAFTYGDMWKFETATNQYTWLGGRNGTSGSQVPGWPSPRWGGSSWRVDRRLYLGGTGGPSIDNTWAYDIDTGTWSQLLDSPNLCDTRRFGLRQGAALWIIPSTTTFGAAEDIYAYGGGPHVGGTTTYNNMWKWNKAIEGWDCVQDYPFNNQVDAAGFRNFTTALDATATRPGYYQFRGAWVYNATLLILQPNDGTALWGYSIPLNRWAVISGPNPSTVIPNNASSPDTLAFPGRAIVSATWTDYFLYATGEPALMLYGSNNEFPTTTAGFNQPFSVSGYGNTWSYSYNTDSWSYYAGGNGYWRGGPSYSPTVYIGTRAGMAIFAGENTPGYGPRASEVYIGLGSVQNRPVQLLPRDRLTYIPSFNDMFRVHVASQLAPSLPPPVEPPADPPIDPPVEPPVDPPVDPPIDPPVEPPVDPPVEPPIDPPVEPPVDPPIDPPVEPPVDPPVEPPIDPPIEPPVEPPTEPPVEPPIDPPVVPPVDPPAEAPADGPVEPPSESPVNPERSNGAIATLITTGVVLGVVASAGVALIVGTTAYRPLGYAPVPTQSGGAAFSTSQARPDRRFLPSAPAPPPQHHKHGISEVGYPKNAPYLIQRRDANGDGVR